MKDDNTHVIPLSTSNGILYIVVQINSFDYVEPNPRCTDSADDYHGYCEIAYEVLCLEDGESVQLTLSEESRLTDKVVEYLLNNGESYEVA